MKLLLDTCTFLWLTLEPAKLSSVATAAIHDADNECFLSAASAWEISVLCSLGRVKLKQLAAAFVPQQRIAHEIEFLHLDEAAATYAEQLPMHHRDPFDRMLVCQSVLGHLEIVTPDPLIALYPVKTIW